MGKKAGVKEIKEWRQDYWRLVKDGSNKEMAAKLGVDAPYLSKIANGAVDKNGKPKNPGADFLKKFYHQYPPINMSQEVNENNAKPNENNKRYEQGSVPLDAWQEAQLRYMHRTDELLEHYKVTDEFSRDSFTKILHINTTMSETQKLSVMNQGAMIASHDKMIDSHDKMAVAHSDIAKGVLLLVERLKP